MVTKEMSPEEVSATSEDPKVKIKMVRISETVVREDDADDADYLTTSEEDEPANLGERSMEQLTLEIINEIVNEGDYGNARMEEVDDEEYEAYLKQIETTGASKAATAVQSEVDEDDEDLDEEETVWERLAALKYALPFSQSQKLSKTCSKVYNSTAKLLSTVGSGAWILATGAMMVLLPVALELEKEQAAIAQENQARIQQNLAPQPAQLGGAPPS